MSESSNYVVITTIQDATPAVEAFAALEDWTAVIVGDKKTPSSWKDRDDVVYLGIDEQEALFPDLAAQLPLNHYSRKNVGYLYAIGRGAELIAESDDDNHPLEGWGTALPSQGVYATVTSPRVANIYAHFTDEEIWPRGFPLELILKREPLQVAKREQSEVAIEQQLVHGEPDVDAIYRLVIGRDAQFVYNEPLVTDAGVYAPFNSQNTFWRDLAFPFLYLPCTVTFRFTDILRGWVAQRCAWSYDGRLAFTAPTVFQDRNDHNLLTDFKSEIPVYLRTLETLDALDSVDAGTDPGEMLVACYDALISADIVPETEMPIVEAWVREVARLDVAMEQRESAV